MIKRKGAKTGRYPYFLGFLKSNIEKRYFYDFLLIDMVDPINISLSHIIIQRRNTYKTAEILPYVCGAHVVYILFYSCFIRLWEHFNRYSINTDRS